MARGLTAGRAPFSLPGSGSGPGFYLDEKPIGNPVQNGRFVCFHSSARFVQPVTANDTVAGGQLPDFKGAVSQDRFPTGLKMGDD
jgi:hypothetical protein